MKRIVHCFEFNRPSSVDAGYFQEYFPIMSCRSIKNKYEHRYMFPKKFANTNLPVNDILNERHISDLSNETGVTFLKSILKRFFPF